MELISAPPNSEGPPGSDSAPRPVDRNPRTASLTEAAQARAKEPPVVWDPRDFSDYETSEAWWTATALYGAILFSVGSLNQWANIQPTIMAIIALALAAFLGLLVLTFAGFENGVAVFVAGGTLLACSLLGLTSISPVGYWWAILFLVLLGALCLAVGGSQALRLRAISLGDEDPSASATV